MRTREDMVLRQVGDTWAIFPVGNALKQFGHIIKLNGTGAFIYDDISRGLSREEVVADMVEQFEIETEKAEMAYDSFCGSMVNSGILDN